MFCQWCCQKGILLKLLSCSSSPISHTVKSKLLITSYKVLKVHLSPILLSSLAPKKIQNGDILVPANPGPPGKRLLKRRERALFNTELVAVFLMLMSCDFLLRRCKASVKSSPSTNQHPVFTDWMPFQSPNQQCQSSEGVKHCRKVLNNAKGQKKVIKPSKLLNDSKISISDCVVSCSWYLVAICTQTCRFWRMFADSIALMHSRESSTDSEPK